jgi:hypothetical protein
MNTSTLLTLIGQTLIATATIMIAWDREDGVPLMQFGLVFGGILLGHVITEALNFAEDDKE